MVDCLIGLHAFLSIVFRISLLVRVHGGSRHALYIIIGFIGMFPDVT